MVTAGASSVFLCLLLVMYVQNHRHFASPFTLGLVFFAAVLLIQNVGSILFYYMMSDAGEGSGVAVPMLFLNAAELVGFGILFLTTWR